MTARLEPEAAYELLGLLAELGRPPRQPRGGPQHRAAEALLARPDLEVYAIRHEGELAGAAAVLYLPRFGHATPEARLLDLIVVEPLRGTGLGTQLIEAAIEAARRRGCHLLRLESGYARTGSHRFYERLGFRDRARDYQLELAGV